MRDTAIVTFIIPSLGRNTLSRTLRSILDQSLPSWRAIVVMDGSPEDLPASICGTQDPRVKCMYTHKRLGVHNHAGEVRNLGLKHVQTPWVGFVDDDDTVSNIYVETLQREIQQHEDAHVIIFRMRMADGVVLPPNGHTNFAINQVGISFVMNMAYVQEKRLTFRPSSAEDFDILNRCREAGGSIRMSPTITYHVRH